MARKRLLAGDFDTSAFSGPAPETKSITRLSGQPPIAQVSADISAIAALQAMTESMAEARDSGRMVLNLPLGAIVPDHLLRDRVFSADADMAALRESIRLHGQRQPVDVSALPARDGVPQWGLISGWRRLKALQELHTETGAAKFASIRALVRRPENAADAYIAMIEENEIRADLSHYERARIVALAVETGVFAHDRAALHGLFGNVSRAKRSKIGSFMEVYRALDAHLRFASAIGERLGLRLGASIGTGGTRALLAALVAAGATTAQAELAALDRALAGKPAQGPDKQEIAPGITLATRRQGSKISVTISGDMVDERLLARITRAIRG